MTVLEVGSGGIEQKRKTKEKNLIDMDNSVWLQWKKGGWRWKSIKGNKW